MTAVLVHGVLETGQVWDGVRPLLGVESVAVGLPGLAGARPAGFAATKDDYAEWLAEAVGRLDGPVDLVGHDWGALLVLRVASASAVRLRSWAVDAANLLHPDYIWHRLARTWQTPGAGEDWMASAREAGPGMPDSTAARLIMLGVPRAQAHAMGAAHDETMSRSILDLYRSAVPNASADWGPAAARPTGAPGLVLLPSADPFNDEAMSREVAARLGARTERLDGLGHCWMAEDPATAAAALRRFWSSLSV